MDLSRGRRRLTISRALQFSSFARFNSLETERLIFLALSDSHSHDVSEFFSSKITLGPLQHKKSSQLDISFFETVEVGAILEVLKWARMKLPAQDICKLLYTFPQLTPQRVEQLIQMLVDKKVIQIAKDESVKMLRKDLALDEFEKNSKDGCGVHIHKHYARSFINFCENMRSPSLFTSGFVEIPRAQFTETATKLLEIRNWLLQFSQETNGKSKSRLDETLVFQFDINLVPAIQKELAIELAENKKPV
jgi:predicted transcriptional regulator